MTLVSASVISKLLRRNSDAFWKKQTTKAAVASRSVGAALHNNNDTTVLIGGPSSSGGGEQQQQRRNFHFASHEYSKTFRNLPKPNIEAIRNNSQAYLKSFDPNLWYEDPITSLVKGEKLAGSETNKIETKDAFGIGNGNQFLATPEQVALLKEHISTYRSNHQDLREPLRKIEYELLTRHSGFLIGNQCIDFGKQDGITEIEESIMANAVERRLNDMVLRDERANKIVINRSPIYVSCVSNFTNFLDLFRKTIRSLELGIPCVVLGRSNTVQHSYRWTQLLLELMNKEGVDPGMLTYLSCSLEDIKDITQSCQAHTGNLYATCSRELAASMMSGYPKTVASTGGPNTLVTTEWTEQVQKAVQMSASIECAGQCTALRHCVTPPTVEDSQLDHVFDTIQEIPSAPYAVDNALFDGVFAKHQGSPIPPTTSSTETDDGSSSYIHHGKVDAYYRVGSEPPPGVAVVGEGDLPEYWRKVVVDFSKMDMSGSERSANIDKLAAWLNQHQPISLAVNGKRDEIFQLGIQLFDKTGMVVYTLGSTDDEDHPPALTCQARPQEAEVFGEFPPRSKLTKYTRYPVVVPSSTPAYDAEYSIDYLESLPMDEYFSKSTQRLLGEIDSKATRGFCVEVIRYLQDATMKNPKMGFGTSRTAVWGLQRPPLGTKSWIRCDSSTVWDAVAPIYLLFHVTNARDQAELSIDPSNEALIALCKKHDVAYSEEEEDSFAETSKMPGVFNVVRINGAEDEPTLFPMAGQFVSLYFPLGHIKSTMPDDHEFTVKLEQVSDKWLTTLF